MEPIIQKNSEKLCDDPAITGRDIQILRYIVENRFAPIKLVEDLFWNSKGNRNHYRRLKRLEKLGYLEILRGDGKQILGYKSKKKSVELLRKLGIQSSASTDLGATYRSGYDHDKTVLDLRNLFELSPLVSEFQAEHSVREALAKQYGYKDKEGNGYKVPDALFKLKTESKGTVRVALELEMAVKSKPRYRKGLKQLSISRDWDWVFIIVSERQRALLLESLLMELRGTDDAVKSSSRKNPIYFAALEDFQRSKLSAIFSGERKSFSLLSLESDSAHGG